MTPFNYGLWFQTSDLKEISQVPAGSCSYWYVIYNDTYTNIRLTISQTKMNWWRAYVWGAGQQDDYPSFLSKRKQRALERAVAYIKSKINDST